MASKVRTTATVTPAQAQAIREYREAKQALEVAQAQADTRKALVNAIFDAHGSPDSLVNENNVRLVNRTEVTRTSLDADTVKRYAPATYARALRTATFPRITLGR